MRGVVCLLQLTASQRYDMSKSFALQAILEHPNLKVLSIDDSIEDNQGSWCLDHPSAVA